MQVSHSRIDTFCQCPYKFKLRYIDKLKTIPDTAPDNALYLGTALHECIQNSIPEALQGFYSHFNIISDEIVTEAIKLEIMGNKARKAVPEDGQAEVELSNDDFKGFIDWLVPAKTDQKIGGEHQVIPYQYDLYDFKYTNNDKNYVDSDQLHLYKYYFEWMHPGQYIRNMYFLFVPKSTIKPDKNEDIVHFRNRVKADCERLQPHLMEVKYDPAKVIRYLTEVKHCIEATEYDKKPQFLCRYCEYQQYCQKGEDYMILPSTERRNIEEATKKVIWIYGQPFSGKTTFANKFPNPLMLNTDGNIKFVDAPFIAIKDEVTVNGRMTTRKFAWEILKEAIGELEKKDNDFQTIVLDLLEDTYDACRWYMYDQLGITHESDDSFRAWDKVRTEFLSTIKRLMNLDYDNIILISHEDASRDFTKKSGDKISAIKPNLQDKTANKVAGMVDIVARVVAEGDDRILSFKPSEVVFGGGRLSVDEDEIPLEYDRFCEVYEEANENAAKSLKKATKPAAKKVEEPVEVEEPEEEVTMGTTEDEEAPKTRTRRRRV